jgi:hypothetical protein
VRGVAIGGLFASDEIGVGVAGMCQLKRQHLQRAGAGQQPSQPAVDKAGVAKVCDEPSGGRQFSGQRPVVGAGEQPSDGQADRGGSASGVGGAPGQALAFGPVGDRYQDERVGGLVGGELSVQDRFEL